VKVGSLRGMPRADLNACKLACRPGQDISAMRVKAGKLARHAARQLERLAAMPSDRGNSSSIPTSCNAVMRRQNRAICPVANLTQWVKAPSCENMIEISKVRTMMSGQLRFLG